MPASYNPTKGSIAYTPPRRPVAAKPLAAPPPTATTAVVPPPPETPTLTKTSGAVVPSSGKTPMQAEAASTAGLPFRDQTVRPLPELSDDDVIGFDLSGPPEEAILSSLVQMGYDPASQNPAVKNLLEAAPAIREAFVIQRVLKGGDTGGITDPVAMSREYAQFVRDVVARGSPRQVATQAAQGATRAAQQIAALPPEGQSGSVFERLARGTLGTQELPGVLSRLYEQQYNVPGEEASGKAALARLQRQALRVRAGVPGAEAQLLNRGT